MITFGKLEVVYEGATMTALSRMYVLLWNRGTAPIESSDFLSPIAISASSPILNLQIQDKDAAASVRLNESTREISVDLLRPGEAIILVAEVMSETFRPEIRVEMKSADMSAFISGFNSLYPSLAAFSVASLLLLYEISIFYAWLEPFVAPGPNTYYPFKEDPGALVSAGTVALATAAAVVLHLILPIIAGTLVQKITKAVLSRTITAVAWKFFEFKLSAWTMRTQSKQYKRSIDAEYKKMALADRQRVETTRQ
jgi:hypothetical protein